MTGKGLPPVVELNRKASHLGLTLGKNALRAVERRLERHPELPQWNILIRPAAPE